MGVKEFMEILTDKLSDRDDVLSPQEREALDAVGRMFSDFVAAYGPHVTVALVYGLHDDGRPTIDQLAQIAAYRVRKHNGDGRKGGEANGST